MTKYVDCSRNTGRRELIRLQHTIQEKLMQHLSQYYKEEYKKTLLFYMIVALSTNCSRRDLSYTISSFSLYEYLTSNTLSTYNVFNEIG